MIFNSVIFGCVIFVLIRHIRGTAGRMKQKIDHKKAVQLMVRIGGVMVLFGLTWLFAVLTVSVPGLRETFQILFTIFNSLQGFFTFIFLCILNQDACESWKQTFVIILKQFIQCCAFRKCIKKGVRISSDTPHSATTGHVMDANSVSYDHTTPNTQSIELTSNYVFHGE